jgi:hypothetical protein
MKRFDVSYIFAAKTSLLTLLLIMGAFLCVTISMCPLYLKTSTSLYTRLYVYPSLIMCIRLYAHTSIIMCTHARVSYCVYSSLCSPLSYNVFPSLKMCTCLYVYTSLIMCTRLLKCVHVSMCTLL